MAEKELVKAIAYSKLSTIKTELDMIQIGVELGGLDYIVYAEKHSLVTSSNHIAVWVIYNIIKQ